MPGPGISYIPVIGPVYDLAGHIIGAINAQGAFTSIVGKVEGNVAKTAASDIFHGLNLNTWLIRIGEIILGVVLIGVGVAKLTSVDNTIAKTAGKLGKLALV